MTTQSPSNTTSHQPGSRDETWGPDKDGSLTLSQVFANEFPPPHPLAGATVLDDGQLIITSSVNHDGQIVFVIAKLTKEGKRVLDFGNGGLVAGQFAPLLNAGGGQTVSGEDGRIYMAGWSKSPDSLDPQVAILCIDSEGERDSNFGVNGQVIVENDSNHYYLGEPAFIKCLPDGSIIVGANYATGTSKTKTATLLKFDDRGNPVSTFGTAGRDEIKLADTAAPTSVNDCCILDNGRILVAGYAQPKGVMKYGLLAMRNSNGTPNLLFADSGISLTTRGAVDTEFNAVTERASDTFLAAGRVSESRQRLASGLLHGFDDKGKPDDAFNAGKMLETNLRRGKPTSWDTLYADKNDIFVAGGDNGTYIAQIELNGGLNPAFGNDGYIEEELTGVAPPSSLLPYQDNKLLYGWNSAGLGGDSGQLYRYYRY